MFAEAAMRTIDVVIYREGRHWVARALNVEVSSFGDSADEARAAIREALELFFEDEPGIEVREAADARLEQLIV
jgi:predicted RNase H-like HicB family nuclease